MKKTSKKAAKPAQHTPTPVAPQIPEQKPASEAATSLRILKNVEAVMNNFDFKGIQQAIAAVEMAEYVSKLRSFAEAAVAAETPAPAPQVPSPTPSTETKSAEANA